MTLKAEISMAAEEEECDCTYGIEWVDGVPFCEECGEHVWWEHPREKMANWFMEALDRMLDRVLPAKH
jgi:hypothetical protein